MTVTQEIKDRLDIVDIIGESMSLRKAGNSYTGFCPFHHNTRTPAFVVFPETQTWRCFGACADGGDVFNYVMRKNGLDFPEALKMLALRAGVELKPQTAARRMQQGAEDRLSNLLMVIADYYHHLLLHAPQAEQARRYLAGRALSAETIATFKIGYALDSWDAVKTHFASLGYDQQDLLAVGVLTKNEDKNTIYDRFRNRIMFPIRNAGGSVVGFGARTLDKDGIPKYLNSPQTILFDKSYLLYNLDLAKRHIREAHCAVVVEGYMDVLQAWQHGFHNVVAQMGTALTEQQLRLLKRQTKKFVIALDADAAGAKATLRSLEVARETLDRDIDFGFDARGLVRFEGRLQTTIEVATLPPGLDPDDIIRKDPAQWEAIIQSAQPTVDYVIDVLTRDLDLTDAKAKSAVGRRITPLIMDIPDAIIRDHYWQILARKIETDVMHLRQAALSVPQIKSAIPQQHKPLQYSKSRVGMAQRQADFLGHCLRFPRLVILVDEKLRQSDLPAVSERDFLTIEDKLLWGYVYEEAFDGAVVLGDWETHFDESVAERAIELTELPLTDPAESDRLPDVLTLSVLSWRLEWAKRQRLQLKQLIDEAKRVNDDEALVSLTEQVVDLSLQTNSINRARHGLSAMSKRQGGVTP